jgi:hypothetical protein
MDSIHLRFKHPFTMLVAGPTGCGKTVLVSRILKNFRSLTTIKASTLKVTWCYGQWQPGYAHQIPNTRTKYVEGLVTEEEVTADRPHLIVVDDLMTELGSSKAMANLFTKGSHHLGVSVVFIVQNVFHQAKEMRNISLNCHYIVLMKNPRDKSQIVALARQFYPEKSMFIRDAYRDATLEPFGYLVCDFTPDCPENMRVRTRITPEESINGAPFVYIPK